MHPRQMVSRLRARFQDCRLVRMSSGDWCLVRDLGLVKGGKGLKHHEVVMAIGLRRVALDRLPFVFVCHCLGIALSTKAVLARLRLALRPRETAAEPLAGEVSASPSS